MSEISRRIASGRGWKAIALLVVAGLLVPLVIGASSWQMQLTLVGLGIVAALATIDLPFENYHLFVPLSGLLYVMAFLNYDGGTPGASVILPVGAGVILTVYYILLGQRHDDV